MKYGAVLRAQVHAEALGLNPLENGEEGVSQLPEKRLELFAKGKKKKKTGFSARKQKSVSR